MINRLFSFGGVVQIALIKIFVLLNIGFTCVAQQEYKLYQGLIPNSKPVKDVAYTVANSEVDSLAFNISNPTITVYPAEGKATGTAVIICPGGGYHTLLIKREGSDVARAFSKLGVTAFVLKYRLPSDLTMQNKAEGPLQDVQQAVRFVRANGPKWGLHPDKIGVMGFSAGGHLAASAGTHLEGGIKNIANPNRPSFMLLINPVISMTDSIGHIGSRRHLLGHHPSLDQIIYHSNELQVSKETPPAFLVHSSADEVVSAENSFVFYQALRRQKIPAALHLYAKGEHGFLTSPSFDEWFGRCIYWMRSMSLL